MRLLHAVENEIMMDCDLLLKILHEFKFLDKSGTIERTRPLCDASSCRRVRPLPIIYFLQRGGGEIRTRDTGKGIPAFQASALGLYATPPRCRK